MVAGRWRLGALLAMAVAAALLLAPAAAQAHGQVQEDAADTASSAVKLDGTAALERYRDAEYGAFHGHGHGHLVNPAPKPHKHDHDNHVPDFISGALCRPASVVLELQGRAQINGARLSYGGYFACRPLTQPPGLEDSFPGFYNATTLVGASCEIVCTDETDYARVQLTTNNLVIGPGGVSACFAASQLDSNGNAIATSCALTVRINCCAPPEHGPHAENLATKRYVLPDIDALKLEMRGSRTASKDVPAQAATKP